MYKTIGIIGGVSPESTILYYQYIVRKYYELYRNYSYPDIIIYSVNFQKYIDWAYEEQWQPAIHDLNQVLTRLHTAGADFAVIACNTLHVVFDQIQKQSPIPLLSIITATVETIKKEGKDIVGLLGTQFTMENAFYRDELLRHRISTLTPHSESREYIDTVILNELSRGIITSDARTKVLTIIDDLIKKGAQGIILGCTELPLLLSPEHCTIRLYDTAIIHADKTLHYALT